MPVGIGLLCLLAGGVAILALATVLRWLAMTLSGARPGSVWDWFWSILDILSPL